MAAVDPPETDPVRQLLRRRPPAAALGWAAAAIGPGSRVVAVRPLASAWLANHALDVADAGGAVHRVVLRRWARPGWDEEDPDFTAAREAAILELLAPTPVPAPALVAADPDGAACDVPALLLSLLPGGPPDLGGDPGPVLEGLAAALPPHPRRGRARARAFEVAAGSPRPYRPCFIHRDYHPGNTLWLEGRLVGVVDWIGGSWGPPSVDLGHMRLNLAWDLGLEAADRFLAAHHALTGLDHHPHWDVVAAVDTVPELESPGPPPEPWLRRMEELVAAALARLGG